MKRFYFTFGVRYHRDAHPWYGTKIPRNGHVLVKAKDAEQARMIMIAQVGKAWAFLYPEDEFWDINPEYIGPQIAVFSTNMRENEDEQHRVREQALSAVQDIEQVPESP